MKKTKKVILGITLIFLFITRPQMIGQFDDISPNKLLIIKEEFPITESQLKEFEDSKKIKFPKDYRDFLLKYNGGVPIKNTPEYFFAIERFYSLGDMKLGIISNQKEIEEYIEEDVEEDFDHLDYKKLIFIGSCERGNVHINCNNTDYGRIFYSNYFGGLGLERTPYASFSELLQNLKWFGEEEKREFYHNEINVEKILPNKIFLFNDYEYYEEDIIEEGLQRFREVLKYYGHPNKEYTTYYSTGPEKKDVITHYINNPILLEYLLSIGGVPPNPITDVNNFESLKLLHKQNANLDYLILSTNNIQIFKYLVEHCNQDINKSYDGEYPLLKIAKIPKNWGTTDYGIVSKYEYLQKIINLGYQIDFKVKDDQGITLEENIKILKELYVESKKRLEKGQFPSQKNKN